MPFKDVDYKKLSGDNIAHNNLYKKIAEINALREGDIPKAELISGKELIHRPSPIELFHQKQEQAPLLEAIRTAPEPMVEAIKAQPTLEQIENKIIRPLVSGLTTQMIQGPDMEEREEEEEGEEDGAVGYAMEYDPDARIDPGIIINQGLTPLSEIIRRVHDFDFDSEIQKAGRLKGNTNQRKNRALKSGNNEKYVEEAHIELTLGDYKDELKSLQKRTGTLTKKQFGTGKAQYGKYLIDKKKLGKGILSISYPSGKKVNGYPNMKVSDTVKKVLLNKKINKKYDLSETEKNFIRNFIDKSEAQVSKSKEKVVCNKTWDRMAVLLGEIKAGNTSPVVKNELADIAHHFYKNKGLDKTSYAKILSLI